MYHFVEHPKFSEECRGFLQRVVAGKVSVVSVASVVADAVHKVMAEEARIQHNLATGAVRFLQHHPAEIAQLNAFVDAAKQLERLPIRLLPVDLSTIRQAAGLA